MATKSNRMVFALPEVRLRYENLFKMRPAFEDAQKGKEKFAATVLLDPTKKAHLKVIKDMGTEINKLAKEMGIDTELVKKVYGGLESKKFHLCMGKGDARRNDDDEIIDGFEGMIYVNATSKRRPLVCDRDLSPLTEEDGKVFSGVWVNFKLDFWTWTYKTGRKGIGANIKAVQFVKSGDPFAGGATTAENEFDNIDDDADLDDGDESDDDSFLD